MSDKKTMLSMVTTGKVETPLKIVLHGIDGVGKTTFASKSPKPIFLGTENGTSQLDVARFPAPKSFRDATQAIEELTTVSHTFETLVIDSLDWLEALLFEQICMTSKVANIEEAGGGYGKGYSAALVEWQKMITKLDELQSKTGMNLIFIAHSQIKTKQDPQYAVGFDRYVLKLNEKAAAKWREYVDCVLFASFDISIKKEQGKTRAYGGADRLLFTEWRSGFDAKNRLGLPPELTLSWDEFISFAKPSKERLKKEESTLNGPASLIAIKCDLSDLVSQVRDPKIKETAQASIERAGDNMEKLHKIITKLQTILEQSSAQGDL